MGFEIEIKARVEGILSLEERVKSLCLYKRDFKKEDTYYRISGEPYKTSFRIRRQGNDTWVTFKKKRWLGSAEVNEEKEFLVSDEQAFRDFISFFEVSEVVKKIKEGSLYIYGDLNVEICTVKNLGRFLEVEKLLEASSEEEVSRSINEIKSFMALVGVTPDRFVEEYYVDLLLKGNL